MVLSLIDSLLPCRRLGERFVLLVFDLPLNDFLTALAKAFMVETVNHLYCMRSVVQVVLEGFIVFVPLRSGPGHIPTLRTHPDKNQADTLQ